MRTGKFAEILAQDHLKVAIDAGSIVEIDAKPPRHDLGSLVGARASGGLRAAIGERFSRERLAGSLVHLFLDDLAGVTLIAGWAWSFWRDDWLEPDADAFAARLASLENVCIGFRPGSSALDPATHAVHAERTREADPLPLDGDPGGWHPLDHPEGPAFRRARRIDLWEEGDRLHIDSAFQDSAVTPDGGRRALHEYRLFMTARAGLVETLECAEGALPYAECSAAKIEARALVGAPLAALRSVVVERLRGPRGCTHLNDALRALADIPALHDRLTSVPPTESLQERT